MNDAEELLSRIRDSISSLIEGAGAVAVAYSGGLDSSIVAALAKEITNVRCYACAMEGSYDATNALAFASQDHVELKMSTLDRAQFRSLIVETALILGTHDPVEVSYVAPIIQVLGSCDEETLLTGAGADELFGGYSKYTHCRDPTEAMKQDLQKMRDELRLIQSAAHALGKTVRTPFVSDRIIEFSDSLPIERKIDDKARKKVLREVAALIGLPAEKREKKAAQYSSGILKAMEREAKEAGKNLSDWMSEIGPVTKAT